MTFNEWWDKYTADESVVMKPEEEIALDAWKASQPKWTYCKDGLPTDKDGKVITTHETDTCFYSHEIKVIRVYVKLETHNPFNETRIDNFCLSTNKFEKYEDLVVAWQPLPEVESE